MATDAKMPRITMPTINSIRENPNCMDFGQVLNTSPLYW